MVTTRTIPLGWRRLVTDWSNEVEVERFLARFQATVAHAVTFAERDGLALAGPTDFFTLFHRGAIRYHNHPWDVRTVRRRCCVRTYHDVCLAFVRAGQRTRPSPTQPELSLATRKAHVPHDGGWAS